MYYLDTETYIRFRLRPAGVLMLEDVPAPADAKLPDSEPVVRLIPVTCDNRNICEREIKRRTDHAEGQGHTSTIHEHSGSLHPTICPVICTSRPF